MHITTARTEPVPMSDRLAFKIPEAAQLLGVTPTTIRRLVARGDLKAVRTLRHTLIAKTELERFLK